MKVLATEFICVNTGLESRTNSLACQDLARNCGAVALSLNTPI